MRKRKNVSVYEAGKIEIGNAVRVSDPCYDLGVWCAGTIEGMLPGKYNCFVVMSDEKEWGHRVSYIEIRHENYLTKKAGKLIPITVGVDSGQCGIYDLEYFEKIKADKTADGEWYDKVCLNTCSKDKEYKGCILDNKCLVSQSGYGDGSYRCYIGENANQKVVSVRVKYI